jgi:hypothetical protein
LTGVVRRGGRAGQGEDVAHRETGQSGKPESLQAGKRAIHDPAVPKDSARVTPGSLVYAARHKAWPGQRHVAEVFTAPPSAEADTEGRPGARNRGPTPYRSGTPDGPQRSRR